MTEPIRVNPYLSLSGFDPSQVKGRDYRAAQLLAQISQPNEPRAVRFVGMPGIGKSTLLHYLSSIHARYLRDPSEQNRLPLLPLQPAFRAEPHRLLFMLIQLKDRPPKCHPFVYLYHQFMATYRQLETIIPDRFGCPMPDVVTQENLDAGDAIDALKEFTRTLDDERFRPVLLLDDYDRAFAEVDWDETARLSPLRNRVAFIFAGTQPLEVVNPRAPGSPFYTTMPPGQLGGLGDIDAVEAKRASRRLVAEIDEGEGPPLPDADIDLVLELAGNHPHLLTLAASDLWDLREQLGLFTGGEKSKQLDEQMRRLFETRLSARFARTFRAYWEWLVPEEYRPRWEDYWGNKPLPGEMLRPLLVKLALDEELTEAEQDRWDPLWQAGLVFKNDENRPQLFSRLFARFIADLVGVTPTRQVIPKHEALYSRVSYLNKKLSLLSTGEEVKSVRGKGYRLIGQSDDGGLGLDDLKDLGEVGARIYEYLCRHAGDLCTFADLEEAAWGTR